MAELNLYKTVGATVVISSVAFSPIIKESIPVRANERYISYDNTEASNNILDTTFTIDTSQNIRDFVLNEVGKSIEIDIKRYEDDPKYHYIDFFDNDKSVEDNFKLAEELNQSAIDQNLQYVFIVGG